MTVFTLSGCSKRRVPVTDPFCSDNNRDYLVYVPNPVPNPVNLIFVFHGGGSTAPKTMGALSGMTGQTIPNQLPLLWGHETYYYYSLNSISHFPFIVVYMQGLTLVGKKGEFDIDPAITALPGTWNGNDDIGGPSSSSADDDEYFNAVLSDLRGLYNIKKVAITGSSDGAIQCYYFMTSSKVQVDCCAVWAATKKISKPVRAIPFLHMHGDQDDRILWPNGGMGSQNWFPSPRDAIKEVAKTNGCDNADTNGLLLKSNSFSDRYVFTNGRVPVFYEVVHGLGHNPFGDLNAPYGDIAQRQIGFIARTFGMV